MSLLKATDWGYIDMMNVYFRAGTVPSRFDMRLLSANVADGTKNWADVSATELVTGGGYTAGGKPIARGSGADGFPALLVVAGDAEISSCYVSWAATADWAAAVKAVCLVAVRATEQLVLYANLASQTVYNQDVVGWTMKFTLKKVV